jgi:glycosyltransferase involved in cell wall biosynthesis
MHFLFFLPEHAYAQREQKFRYENMIKGSGFSGTDASVLEHARYLTRQGHHVQIILNEESQEDGVCFLNVHKLSQYDFSTVNVFSPLQFINQQGTVDIILKLPKTCLFVWWMHCFPNDYDTQVANFVINQGLKLIAVTPSEFVTNHVKNNPFSSSVTTIKNSIDRNIFTLEKLQKPHLKKGNFSCHSSFERGGIISYKVFQKFREHFNYGTFHVCSYYMGDAETLNMLKKDQNVNIKGSLSKERVSLHLNSCDYFVYALALPNGCTCHDTYACCIHEALASGVIVITWDVAGHKNLYGDAIVLVEHIPHPDYNPKAPYNATGTWNHSSDEAISKLFNIVKFFEDNPIEKEKQRQRAIDWAFHPDRTWLNETKKFEQLCINESTSTSDATLPQPPKKKLL